MNRSAHAGVVAPLPRFGFATWSGQPTLMERSHRHGEIEVNLLTRGAMTYLFGGAPATLAQGRLTLFWAAMPHRLIYVEEGAVCAWITIPLAMFLRWRLSGDLTARALSGAVVSEPDDSRASQDGALLQQWRADLVETSAAPRAEAGTDGGATGTLLDERRAIVALELEARLRRLALAVSRGSPGASAAARGATTSAPFAHEAGEGAGRAEAMARVIAERYAEPLTVGEVARRAGLHPNYAMQVFRARFDMSVVAYLTQQRVAHAQRLLATTELDALEVAYAVGFGSASRFYAAFKAQTGQTPAAFRASLRGA